MTRDRPAAGGQDSTLGGEFPEDLGDGGGGGARVEPSKIATPFGLKTREGPFKGNVVEDSFVKTEELLYQNMSPVLRINDSILYGSNSLSGVYQFSSPYILRVDFVNFSHSNNITPGQTITDSMSISATGANPGKMQLDWSLYPTGTGNIPQGSLNMVASITGFTGGQQFSTYRLPSLGVMNGVQISSGERFYQSIQQDFMPAYGLTYPVDNNLEQRYGVVPEYDTTFNLNLSISLGTGATTVNPDVRIAAPLVTSISQYGIISTLTSSL